MGEHDSVDRTDGASTEGPPRRRRSWRLWLGLLFGVLAISMGVAYVLAQRRARATIARHREVFLRERDVLAAKPRGREAILGPARRGTSESVQAAFFAALAAVPEEERAALRYDGSYGTSVEIAEEERVIDAHPEVLAALGDILHVPSRPAMPAVDLVAPPHGPPLDLLPSISLWLDAATRRAASRGDRRAAVRIALQTCALGADLQRAGPLVTFVAGARVERRGLERLRDALDLSSEGAEIRPVAEVLAALDASRAHVRDALAFDAAAFRGSMTALEGDELANVGWRHLWSFRVYLAANLDAWDEARARLDEIAVVAEGNAREAIERAEALDEALSDAPLARMSVVVAPGALRTDAQVRATRVVARTAVAVALHRAETGVLPSRIADLVPDGSPAVPTDPWDGRPLRWSAATGKVWSIGADGTEEVVMPPGPDGDADSDDVVWDVGRSR